MYPYLGGIDPSWFALLYLQENFCETKIKRYVTTFALYVNLQVDKTKKSIYSYEYVNFFANDRYKCSEGEEYVSNLYREESQF